MDKTIDKKYTWDLSRVFKDNKEYEKAISDAYSLVDKVYSYKGKILESSDSLYEFLICSDECTRLIEKIYVYSYLCYYDDGNEKNNKEKSLKASNLYDYYCENSSFVRSELLSTSLENILKYIKNNKKLEKYRFNLESLFRFKKYTLSEKEENIIALAGSAFGTPKDTSSALKNLDVHFGYVKDAVGNKILLTESNYVNLLQSFNRKVRKDAFKCLYKFYSSHINTLSNLYLGSIKEHFFISKSRGYKNPLNVSLFNDNISENLYFNLINVTNKNLHMLHNYMKFKSHKLGLKKLHMYDVYAPFTKDSEKKISYEESIDIILNALKPLGSKYLDVFKELIDKRCVDVYPKKGKRSGAYQWSTYDIDPYVSLNYVDNVTSVITFAHEMGHALHTYFSKVNQDYIYSEYPIFLAEIASTVNEMLLSEYLIETSNDKEKITYLYEFLEKARATIFRQVMFSEFESGCYDKYDKNIPLTKDELCNFYHELNKKYFGNNVINDEEIKYEWTRIPHFYTPFYVYKYATGFVCALVISSKLISKEEGFKDKYIDFLSSGCSDYPLEIIKKLGIDLEDEKTLQIAFDYFDKKFCEFKELLERK